MLEFFGFHETEILIEGLAGRFPENFVGANVVADLEEIKLILRKEPNASCSTGIPPGTVAAFFDDQVRLIRKQSANPTF